MGTKRHFFEVGKDILTYGFMSALSQMSGLLLLPLFTRIFSVDEYGVIDIFAVFISLLTTGLQVALPSALARYFNDTKILHKKKQLISVSLIFILSIGLLSIFVISLFATSLAKILFDDQKYYTIIILGCWIALSNSLISLPNMILRLERKIITFNLINFLSTILYLILALYFVLVLKGGVEGVFAGQLMSTTISLFVALVLIRNYLTPNLAIEPLKRALKYSLPLLPGVFVSWINSQADRILLLFIAGLGGVAIFGAAARISKIFTFLVLAFRQAWHPYSMLIIKSAERNEIYRRMLSFYTGIFVSLGLVLTAISPELFTVLVPEEYHHGYIVVPWLIGAIALHQSASLTNLGMLVSEKTAGISFASWISVMLNIIISLFLIQVFGIAGAAIGSFIAELVFTALLWRFSIQKSDVRFNTKAILIMLFTYIAGVILLLLITAEIDGTLSIIARTLLLFVAIFIVARQTINTDQWAALKVSLNRLYIYQKKRKFPNV